MQKWVDEGIESSKSVREDYPEFKHAEPELQFEFLEKRGDA